MEATRERHDGAFSHCKHCYQETTLSGGSQACCHRQEKPPRVTAVDVCSVLMVCLFVSLTELNKALGFRIAQGVDYQTTGSGKQRRNLKCNAV